MLEATGRSVRAMERRKMEAWGGQPPLFTVNLRRLGRVRRTVGPA